ncbi:hypothetical protein ACFPRL_02460 [Pseudoclavibacter helvolus]
MARQARSSAPPRSQATAPSWHLTAVARALKGRALGRDRASSRAPGRASRR